MCLTFLGTLVVASGSPSTLDEAIDNESNGRARYNNLAYFQSSCGSCILISWYHTSRERDSLGSLLLATGSADNNGYIFPLTAQVRKERIPPYKVFINIPPSPHQGQGGEHVQQLSGPNGHTGRVYAVHFHLEPSDTSAPPSPPALLTASADNTVKVSKSVKLYKNRSPLIKKKQQHQLWTTPKAAMRPISYVTSPSYDL